jgi:hypothetical protein
MDNRDLISQYVDTGVGIPEYQFNQLSNNDKKTYLRKMEISIKHDYTKLQYYYGELPEETQLAVVNQNCFAIEYIQNPTEKVQLAALKQNGYSIKKIVNPSEAVQLAAVNQNGYTIEYIENPSERVQLAAVKGNGFSILFLENPSDEVQIAAVNNVVSKSDNYRELNDNLLSLYKHISEKNKLKVVNYLINNHLIHDSFYLKLDDNTKQYVLDKILSNKISMGEEFYESLPEDKKLEYLEMEIDKANEKNKLLVGWVRGEYKKMTGIDLVRIDKQYIKQNG